MGSTHVGEVHGGLPPVGEPLCWSRGRVRVGTGSRENI